MVSQPVRCAATSSWGGGLVEPQPGTGRAIAHCCQSEHMARTLYTVAPDILPKWAGIYFEYCEKYLT